MTHGLQQLVSALQGGKSSRSSEQLYAIQSLQYTLTGWTRKTAPVARTDRLADDQKMWADRQLAPPTPRVPSPPPHGRYPTSKGATPAGSKGAEANSSKGEGTTPFGGHSASGAPHSLGLCAGANV